MRLGIDFGTTRTVVAGADRGNHPVLDFVDDAGDARGWIPTLVAERRGELRYGLDAVAVAEDPSFHVVRSFKRLLSSPHLGPSETVAIGGSAVAIGDLVTGFLGHVREAILKRSTLKPRGPREPEMVAVVGVPANAFAAQRLMTLDGFRKAGFTVAAMVNEPSAAGFEYTHRHRDTLTSRRDTVVVYDLGGGTFDASLVRMAGKHHEVVGTAGVNQLGGDDFDVVLAQVALAAVRMKLADLPARIAERWIEQCRIAKEALNANSRKIPLDLEAVLGPDAPKPEVNLPIAAFYEACTPLVEQSIEAMAPLITRASKAEVDGLDSDIAGIYVVGGASELPVIGRALRERFGRRVHRSPYPSAAVAMGLSIASDEAGDFQLVDRASRTFAVFREAGGGSEIVLDPIFAREEVLPVSEEPTVSTRSYRAVHNIGHYRFFECTAVDERGKPSGDMAVCRDVLFPFDPALAERADLDSIPVERRPGDGPRIVEHYSLDQNGIVHVRIRNADNGYERAYRIGG
ncbi:MAG TPA: Hsp70 family protein [Polyangiaceae bacterium]|nr:Hsp70 family protein [Polyangiaceae bacterium]